jgi:hypothetical protein
MAGWLSIALPFPMTYKRPQQKMQVPVLGVVLHTTNHLAGEESITRFRGDWQAMQKQSAHFVVDRTGLLGQCRSLTEVAWHIGKNSTRYIGVEHVAKPDTSITDDQIKTSAKLLVVLNSLLSVPLQAFSSPGDQGVGIHVTFHGTRCGRNVFWAGSNKLIGQFGDILDAAQQTGATDVDASLWDSPKG